MTTHEARDKAQEVKAMLTLGKMTYDEAKTILEPILAVLDAEGRRIAAKYGKKYTPIPINKFLR